MSKCPAERESNRGMRVLLSGKSLAAVLIVAVLAVSCFVFINDSDDSSAAYAQHVRINTPDNGDYCELEDDQGEHRYEPKWSVHYKDGELILDDSDDPVGTGPDDASSYDDSKYDSVSGVDVSTALHADGDLTLVLRGSTPELFFKPYDSDVQASYGIYVAGNLTIRNESDVDRVLYLQPGKSDVESAGIYCGGTLTVQNNSSHSFTVDARGNDKLTDSGNCASYGIKANSIDIQSGTVIASGGVLPANASHGLTSAGIEITGDGSITLGGSSELSVTGGDATYSYGIHAAGDLDIVNASTTGSERDLAVSAGKAKLESAGISSVGSLSLTNNGSHTFTVDADGGDNSYDSAYSNLEGNSTNGYKTFGVSAKNGLTVGSKVILDATGGNVTYCTRSGVTCSVGVLSGTMQPSTVFGSNLTIDSGGKIIANGGRINNSYSDSSTTSTATYATRSAGICAGETTVNGQDGETVIQSTGGLIEATGGSAGGGAGGKSYGMYVSSLTLNGGIVDTNGWTITPKGNIVAAESYGIYVSGSLTVKANGKLIANSEETKRYSYGIYVLGYGEESIKVTGGIIEATSEFTIIADGNGASTGIYSNGGLVCNGGTITGQGGIVCSDVASIGIDVMNVVLSNGASVTGNGGQSRYSNTGTYIAYTSGGFANDSIGIKLRGDTHEIGVGSTLTGTGGMLISETTTLGSMDGGITCGIRLTSTTGSVLITGDGTIVANGGQTKYNPYTPALDQPLLQSKGLYSECALSVSGTAIDAIGGRVCITSQNGNNKQYNGSVSCGLDVGSNLSLSNGAIVNALGGNNGSYSDTSYMPYYNDSYGAFVNGNTTVSGSVLHATAGIASRMVGLYLNGQMTISNGSTVVVTSDPAIRIGNARVNGDSIQDIAYGIVMRNADDSADIEVSSSELRCTAKVSLKSPNGNNTITAEHIAVGTPMLIFTSYNYSSLANASFFLAINDEYTVTYDSNGGGGSMTGGKELGMFYFPSCSFTAPMGKEFAGWTVNDTDGDVYRPGNYYEVISNTVIYAKWVPHTFEVIEAVEATCTQDGNIAYWHCTSCGNYYRDAEGHNQIAQEDTVVAALGHDLQHHDAVAATCTAAGMEAYDSCSRCDYESVHSPIAALGHIIVNDPAVNPTCTESGETAGTHCSRCHEVLSGHEPISALGHSPVTDAAVAPTCITPGLTEGRHCSVCGTVIVAQENVPELGHQWGEWQVTEQATCTSLGTETHYCTRDHNHSESRTIPMIKHDLEAHGVHAATCTEDGNLAYWECTVCHRLFSDSEGTNQTTVQDITVAATGHTSVPTATVNPTCTEAGHTGGTHCSVCDAVLVASTPTPALGHDWEDWETIEPATEYEDGIKHRECLRCSAEENGVIPALGHDHTPNMVLAVQSTCTVAGHSAYWECTSCHKYFSDQECTHEIELSSTALPLATHTNVTVPGVAPTCTSTGLTDGIKCSVCDLVIEERQVIPMTDHDLVHHEASAPTCTEDGNNEYWQCSVCHGYFSDANGNTSITESATVRPATGHTSVTDDYVPATCTSVGHTEGSHCSVCGTVIIAQEEIPMLAHVVVHHDTNPATCTAAGTYEYWQCMVCERYFSNEACTVQITQQQTVQAALDHDIKHHDAVAATCTAEGTEAYDYCSRCDYETSHSTIPALGHNYIPTVTAPTCTEQGYTTHNCSRCHDSYVDSNTEALGHAYSATYGWAADGSSCIVHIVCANDATHNADVNATVTSSVKTAATTSFKGVTTYSVSGTYQGYAYSDSMDVTDIPALEPMPAHKEGTSTYENEVTENMETAVTETFNTAKNNGGDVEVTVSTTAAGSMTIAFDNAAVNAIAGNEVSLEATVKTSAPEAAGAELVIEISLKGATFADGKAKVSVPFSETVPEGKTVKVYFINGDVREDMNATLVDGKVVFETNHFSTYAIFFEDAPAADDSGSNGGGFPVWAIILIVVVVLAAAGAGAFFIVKNKKA